MVEMRHNSMPEKADTTDLIFTLSPHRFRKILFNLLCRLVLNPVFGKFSSMLHALTVCNLLEAFFHRSNAGDGGVSPVIGSDELIISLL